MTLAKLKRMVKVGDVLTMTQHDWLPNLNKANHETITTQSQHKELKQ